ncbi:TonB-dependent receptor [Sphingomonas koreensis]|jgi:iron complex outermembrane receptor protein|uniref:TonB-dependent receptor n=1 Tax=Sphingomonas koreensis TaxID=93064 RepID=A0A1L6J7G6_9SPHN|nr:TonB-dependent receptor [Sphingomonas koreensis]APR51892.1 TonB-dependent receptor [Sphingomonas koreensis]MDC7812110.1 TonB-dependent receptor [Sphingomonas koreensis]RSU21510.1 TonB-dependent receptor [Sphingomonas koreensis]RSU30831.1 TonB-dependent receptor [Sphingomonas koreensis]RSU31926.1 TonB-dependent receptor [Sphingomonas koreensis]
MKRLTLLLATTAFALPALAQTSEHQERDRSSRSTVHGDADADVVITAPYVADLDLLAGTSVVSGDELVRDIRGQIGDTLTRVPGVSATSFSPGASRPVLRGFQGERVRVLTDGLGSLDVSNTSTDHAVTIDPLTAERIEVLRGPAVLLFGSQAIGGAVNVIDRRIPRAVPENGFHIDAVGTYGSAADERSGGAAVDVALTPTIVLHADGSYRKTDDLRTGGYILSKPLRAQQLAIAAEETEEGHLDEAAEATALANSRGRLPNSGTETYTLGGGVALINDGGSLGFSVGYYDTKYGVPERPAAGHDHDADGDEGHDHGAVTIGMKQWRADMRGEVNVGGGFLDKIRVRAGFADYEHTEFEGTDIGTVFNSEAIEGRLELVQANRGGWRGVIGFQGLTRKFSAVGEEAFVAPNTTAQYGVFALQEVNLGKLGLEFAGRYEHTDVRSNAVKIGLDEDAPLVRVDRGFDAFSGAVGLSYEVAPEVKIGINGSRAVRAPSGEELFSNGPHIATQAYEVGNPNFALEKSWGLELYARGRAGPVRFQISGYANWFDNYIYENDTGTRFENDEFDLPIFQYLQADARYYGIEGEISATLLRAGDFSLSGNLVADYVNAELGNGSPVPRIPPLRVLGGLDASYNGFGGRVEVEHSTRQSRVANFETETPAFTLVNASLTWHPFGEKRETAIILSANNIFDVEARRHASFTKDFVPLAGRDIRVAARVSF